MSAKPGLKLVGGYGSPYSRKMRAVLRYRRIPFLWVLRGSPQDVGIPDVPVALIPVLVWPGAGGAPDEAMIDSTFQIRRLEREYPDRSIIPPDAALAFLDALVEDYADEWLTKAMFHYRWAYADDIAKAGKILPLDRDPTMPSAQLERMSRYISERQIARLGVVGSNPTTAPVIEESYRRLLHLLDRHIEAHGWVLGQRPASSDFGLFGQLSQLVLFDPTAVKVAEQEAPRVIAWAHQMEDLSWIEPEESGWMTRSEAGAALRALLEEIGGVYAPFLRANAAAIEAGAERVECQIDGQKWTQQPFPYQAKCLHWLRESHAALTPGDRAYVDDVLTGTGCDSLFVGS